MDKPLHVRVAEALGYPEAQPCELEDWHFDSLMGSGSAYRPEFTPIWRDHFGDGEWHCCVHGFNVIPRYDTDWSTTGPLIQEHGFRVTPILDGNTWQADLAEDGSRSAQADTPLVAVCNLILALKEAGKL